MIGYGSQGRALALNLRDSGYPVIAALRSRSRSRPIARADRITVDSIEDAVRQSSIIVMAVPDQLHGTLWRDTIAGSLQGGATIVFLHGTSVHFGLVKPPANCDLMMIAPHAPGIAVREAYLTTRSISAFSAVQQDASGKARQTLHALAVGMGFAKKNLVRTTFTHEAIGDLFGEQAVLCGGMSALITSGFATLVKNGHSPEHAWLEVAYQLDLIIALIKQFGIAGMLDRISLAARYGAIETGPKVIGKPSIRAMETAYKKITSGAFVRQLTALPPTEISRLRNRYAALTSPQLERAAARWRKRK